jgi:hypothetical protein
MTAALVAFALIPGRLLLADPIFVSASRSVTATAGETFSTTELLFWNQSTSGSTTETTGGGSTFCNASANQSSTINSTSIDFSATLAVTPFSTIYHTCANTQAGASMLATFTLTDPTPYVFTTTFSPFDPFPSAIRNAANTANVKTFSNAADRTGTLQPGTYLLRIDKRAMSSINPMTSTFHETLDFTVPGLCCRGATCNAVQTEASCAASISGSNAGAVFTTAAQICNAGGSTSSPCCYADYDKLNGLAVQDIFAYLNDWFAGSPFANTAGDGQSSALTVQHIFDFLNAWFVGCP